MLNCIRFILNFVSNFAKMLFTIDIGDNMSLGLLMCIIFIFLPVVYRVITFLKHDVIGELDELYDESRPRESHTAVFTRSAPYNNGRISYTHTLSKSRRWRH